MSRRPQPGVSRERRLSEEGLQRLQRQLESSMRVSAPVLLQWVRRYGDEAVRLIERSGRMTEELRQSIAAFQEDGNLP